MRGQAAIKKTFRIERMSPTNLVQVGDQDLETQRHQEIMDAIAAIGQVQPSQDHASDAVLESIKEELAESNKLKAELDEIRLSIIATKRDIASLHQSGFVKDENATVSDELDAVVKGTEQATEKILTAAESIENNAANLANSLNREGDHNMALDIQEQAISIFEACNFQDLTGQRITKVVNTMKFIEERVDHMISIWGGEDGFSGIKPEKLVGKTSDAHLLHGPSMEDDIDTASQDDIDALFD